MWTRIGERTENDSDLYHGREKAHFCGARQKLQAETDLAETQTDLGDSDLKTKP